VQFDSRICRRLFILHVKLGDMLLGAV